MIAVEGLPKGVVAGQSPRGLFLTDLLSLLQTL